ncbi:MAG: type III pantothenate kinase [Planctomycetota bacterium]
MTRRVAVDVGNSFYHLALENPGGPPCRYSLPTRQAGASETLLDYLADSITTDEPIDWHVASVCGPAKQSLFQAIEEKFSCENHAWYDVDFRWISESGHSSLRWDVDAIDRVGIDRLLAASAGRRLAGPSVVVIDSGSAITVDLVDDGTYRGGIIAAGLAMQSRALAGDTENLFAIDVDAIDVDGIDSDTAASTLVVPGKNTADAMLGGMLYGTAGGIDRVVAEYRRLVGRDIPVVATGGDLRLLKPYVHIDWIAAEHLVTDELLRLTRPASVQAKTWRGADSR